MNARDYIKQQQQLWALRNQIAYNRHGYVDDLRDNLACSLSPEVEKQFREADGNELEAAGEQGPKMHALHSSAALAVNVFNYWIARSDRERLAEALEIPSRNIRSIRFEARLPISGNADPGLFPKMPNIDVLIEYAERSDKLKAVGIESKFSEAYGQHDSLREAYFVEQSLWAKLPRCKEVADECRGKPVVGLNTPQLLKHLLALRNHAGLGPFWLVYLWYGVPSVELATHYRQLDAFKKAVEADGGRFTFLTYQELLCRFYRQFGDEHREYVDYLAGRYL